MRPIPIARGRRRDCDKEMLECTAADPEPEGRDCCAFGVGSNFIAG